MAQWWRIHLKGRRCGFNPWIRKVPWGRKWQATPVFLPGKFRGQRSLVSHRPMACKETQPRDHVWGLRSRYAFHPSSVHPSIHSPIDLFIHHFYWYHLSRIMPDDKDKKINMSNIRLSRWPSGKESACQCSRCRRHRFNPCMGTIPWRRKWQSTPVFLPGESYGQRSLVGCSPWGRRELDATKQITAVGSAILGRLCFSEGECKPTITCSDKWKERSWTDTP